MKNRLTNRLSRFFFGKNLELLSMEKKMERFILFILTHKHFHGVNITHL
jgi:hypothetical protein